MSLLDQAFVKAYGRSQSKASLSEGVAAPHFSDQKPTAEPVISREQESTDSDAAMTLGDLLDETYFRVDVSHTPIIRSMRLSTVAAAGSNRLAVPLATRPLPIESSPSPTAQPESMATRQVPVSPMRRAQAPQVNPSAVSHTLTAYDQTSAVAAPMTTPRRRNAPDSVSTAPPSGDTSDAAYLRIDDSHRQRRGMPVSTEDAPVVRRVNHDVDEATAFALAKAEAYAREIQVEVDRQAIARDQAIAARQAAEQKAVAAELAHAERLKAEQKRAAEEKLAEQKLAEQQAAEQRLVELKREEERLAEEQRAEELRIEKQRAEEEAAALKLEEEKLAQELLAKQKLAEKKLVEQKLAEFEISLQQKAVLEAQIAAEKETTAAAESRDHAASSLRETLAETRKTPFAAVWEVDAFEFTDTIVELFGNASLMKSIGVPLDHAVAVGLRSILITSSERSVGRTSVAIGIAVSAASAGLKVAIVDADVTHAGLADALHLEVQNDWLDAMHAGLPLDEVAVRSIEDQFTVVPAICSQSNVDCSVEQFDAMMSLLREAFDLVIIDGSPWFDSVVPLRYASTIDAAIVVVDVTKSNPASVNQLQNNLRHAGVAGLGIVENFG